ncbi:hypothetical protein LAZ67_20001957 [Cordylochernes scorpioides]|uniref:Uncharacterized protein n=1 Tax=Cordylochernes scorpioides TaxID=51811 RepID=A0ABY6LM44_9ARAC|nr:hypothetical protein LAZ67_20001957 [Cordylochernes scorpioides]
MAIIYDSGFKLLPNAPYSPDLAPSDFNLFPHLKKSITGIHFRSDEEVIDAVTSFFESLETSFFLEGINALEHRWKKNTPGLPLEFGFVRLSHGDETCNHFWVFGMEIVLSRVPSPVLRDAAASSFMNHLPRLRCSTLQTNPKTSEKHLSGGSPFLWQYLSALPLVGGHERLTRRVATVVLEIVSQQQPAPRLLTLLLFYCLL